MAGLSAYYGHLHEYYTMQTLYGDKQGVSIPKYPELKARAEKSKAAIFAIMKPQAAAISVVSSLQDAGRQTGEIIRELITGDDPAWSDIEIEGGDSPAGDILGQRIIKDAQGFISKIGGSIELKYVGGLKEEVRYASLVAGKLFPQASRSFQQYALANFDQGLPGREWMPPRLWAEEIRHHGFFSWVASESNWQNLTSELFLFLLYKGGTREKFSISPKKLIKAIRTTTDGKGTATIIEVDLESLVYFMIQNKEVPQLDVHPVGNARFSRRFNNRYGYLALFATEESGGGPSASEHAQTAIYKSIRGIGRKDVETAFKLNPTFFQYVQAKKKFLLS